MNKRVYDILFDEQKKVVNSVEDNNTLLMMETGTGKTFCSLSIYQEYFEKNKKLIIICLINKMEEWKEDIELFWKNKKIVLLNKTLKKDNQNLVDADIVIVNFERVPNREKIIKQFKNSLVIVDESHKLNSPSNKLSKILLILKKTEMLNSILLLSATPVAKYQEWYVQFKLLGVKIKNQTEWKNNFFVVINRKLTNGGTFPDFVKTKKIFFDVFNFLKNKKRIIVKKNTFLGLKDLHIKVVYFEKDPELEKIINKGFLNSYQGFYKIEHSGTKYLHQKQISSGFIANQQEELLWEGKHFYKKQKLLKLLENNENDFIIFYQFKQELQQIKNVCNELNIKYFEYHGELKQKKETLEFKGRKILIGQFQSLGTGLNDLQVFNNAIFYSLPNWLKYKQSIGRIYRKGQKNVSNITLLLCDNKFNKQEYFKLLKQEEIYKKNYE